MTRQEFEEKENAIVIKLQECKTKSEERKFYKERALHIIDYIKSGVSIQEAIPYLNIVKSYIEKLY